MDIFAKIFSSMFSQNLVGWIVIILVILMFILGLTAVFFIKKYYKELQNDLLMGISSRDKVYFNNDGLNSMVQKFIKSTKAGTDNINTEVIIEKSLDEKILKLESILKVIPGTLIALGLLGTFLGLTLAIFETKSALNGIENINTFSTALQNPIASMATAFWTSIFGVVCSIILNFNRASAIDCKRKFQDEIENYLDNEVFAKRAKTFNTIFEEFSITVKTTMLTLTEEMTVLFKNGVEELVNKINSNSLDLTSSAKELKNYTEKFRELVSEMDSTVKNFNEPVKNFSNSVKDFTIVSAGLEDSFNKSIDKLDNSIVGLDWSMNNLGKGMSDSFDKLDKSMKISFKVMGERIENSSINFTKELKETSNTAAEKLEGSSNLFLERVMASTNTISAVVERNLINISKDMKENFDNMSSSIDNSLDSFTNNINESMGQTGANFKESILSCVDLMENSFATLDKSVIEERKSLEELMDILRKEGQLTENRTIEFNNLIKQVTKINEVREVENIEQLDKLNSSYLEFKKIVLDFKSGLKDMNSSIADELSKALDKKLTDVGNDFSKILSNDLKVVVKEVSNSTENLNESITIVGELVKASNDWASAVAYSLSEVGSDSLR
ncbi:MAG: hypothetical protein ACRDD2_10630 [Sarcina sp.]